MNSGRAYEFVFRGILADEALDQAGRTRWNLGGLSDADIAAALSIDLLDPDLYGQARKMAIAYAAIAAFENSARRLVKTVLVDQFGSEWWEKGFSQGAKKRAEQLRADEESVKWQTPRGADLIDYTQLKDLVISMETNRDAFEPFVRSVEWAKAIFGVIERARNVIMHSGVLGEQDIERVGINIRDWVKQVGS